MSLRDKILELRNQNFSYKRIAKELHCSTSTVSYHCSVGEKAKTKLRKQKIERWIVILGKKIDNFKNREKTSIEKPNKCTWEHLFRTKVSFFKNRNKMKVKVNYTYKDVLKYLGGTKVKCSLTGRPIDITKDEYCLDHIVPVNKGGDNELTNLTVTCKEANLAKSGLTNEEFLELCIEILTNFGYKVSK